MIIEGRVKLHYWKLREAVIGAGRNLLGGLSDYFEQLKVLFAFLITNRILRLNYNAKSNGKSVNVNNLVVLSYYSYPYLSRHGTQRLGKFIKYLSRMGWRITLITTNPIPESEIQTESENYPESVRVIRLNVSLPKKYYWKGVLVPDSYIYWVIPAARAALSVIQKEKPGAIFATAPPYSNLLVGAMVSKLSCVPLISDFRDPWSQIDTGWRLKNALLSNLSELLEKKVLIQSSRVIMADPICYMDIFFPIKHKYLSKKTVSILNGYDEEDFSIISGDEILYEDKFVISYVGTFYDYDTFINIVKPIVVWFEKYPEDFKRVILVYAGAHSSFLQGTELSFLQIEDKGYVSHRDSIFLRAGSNLQIFSQPMHFKPHVMSGKIYEMIRSQVPIVAITNPEGGAASLILESKTGKVFSPDDFLSTANYLREQFLIWRRNAESFFSPDIEVIASLSRKSQARRLGNVLRDVIADKGGLINSGRKVS